MPEIPLKLHIWYDDQWNDHTDRLRGEPSPDGAVRIKRGRQDWAGSVDFGTCRFSVNNRDGYFSPRNPLSPLYGKIGRNTPIMIDLDDPELPEQARIRMVGEVSRWPQRWITDAAMWVPLEASGILRRLGKGSRALESPLRRHYLSPALQPYLMAYLPLEDGQDATEVANLVEGQYGVRYARGSAPDFVRAPQFGRDDSCLGSAPLPEWPAIPYFNWSRGASVSPPPLTDFIVQVTVRVPAGAGQTWLCEWRTSGGTHNAWALRTTAGGAVQVTATNDADAPATLTYTTTAVIDDNGWRTIQVACRDLGGAQGVWVLVDGARYDFSSSGASLGSLRAIRPRPMYADSTDKEPIGLGHAAVLARVDPLSGNVTGNEVLMAQSPPVDGHAGERAADRVERLLIEAEVPRRIVRPLLAADDFDRTESGGWGGDWESIGSAAAYSVIPGEGRIVATGSSTRRALLPGQHADVDVRALVGTSTSSGAPVLTARAASAPFPDAGYEVLLDSSGGVASLQLYLLDESYFLMRTVSIGGTGGFNPAARWWLRLQCDGTTIRAKGWLEGDPEPPQWQIEAQDGTHAVGRVGVAADTITGSPTISFAQFAAAGQDSARLGPQQIATLLDNAQAAADTDGGLLHETRDELGLTFRTLGSLYNQDAGAELDYQRPDGSGDVFDPFDPVEDDQALTNQVTASRPDGGSARVTRHDGPLGVDQVGLYDTAATVGVASDEQLPGQAAWRVHLGTWDEARWPHIAVNLARLRRTGRAELAAAVAGLESGDRLTVDRLPAHLPPGLVDQLVQGYAETLDDHAWQWQANATPAGPVEVAVTGATPASGLVVAGQTGAYASTPHHADLALTGDLDILVDATGHWGPNDFRSLVAKFDLDVLSGQGQWWLNINGDGQLRFTYSTTGENFQHMICPVLPIHRAGIDGRLAVWCQFRNVGGNRVATWSTAATMAGPWTLLGQVTQSGEVTFHDGNAPLEVGTRSQGTEQPWVGTIHAAEVRNAANVVVASPRFDEQPPSTTSFEDSAGREWTVHGDAVIEPRVADVRGQRVDSDHTTLADPLDAEATEFDVSLDLAQPLAMPWTTDPTDWDPELHGGPLLIEVGGEVMQVTGIVGEPTPPVVRHHQSVAWFGSSTTILAPAHLPGDVLLLFQTADLGTLGAMQTPTGGEEWLELSTQSGQSRPSKVWWKLAGDNEPAGFGITQSSGADGVAIVVSVGSVDPTQLPPLVATGSQAGSGSTISTPSTSPTGINKEIRFASADPGGLGRIMQAPPGFALITSRASDEFVVGAGARRPGAAGASGAHSFSVHTDESTATVSARHGFTVNLLASVAQTFGVIRSVNGIQKAHPAGTPVRVAHQARVGL